jgi:hypothetical protein
MREVSRGDGCVTLYGDEDNLVVVEPMVLGFAPVPGMARCACGAPLKRWSWRHVTADNVEITCDRCRRALAFIRLAARAHAS